MRILLFTLFFIHTSMALASALEDSVGTQVIRGKIFVLHRIEHKETLWGISKRYDSSISEVMKYNREKTPAIRIGDTLLIPTDRNVQGFAPVDIQVPVYHIVGPGENLYRIGRQYSVPFIELKKLNNLETVNVDEGQKIIIRYQSGPKKLFPHIITQGQTISSITRMYDVPKGCLTRPDGSIADSLIHEGDTLIVDFGCEDRLDTMRYRQTTTPTGRPKSYQEEGLAEMIPTNGTLALALHQAHTKDQMITVINPATKRKLAVKVIGSLSPVDKRRGLVIKLSKYACQRLGIVQKQTKVYLLYDTGEDEESAE